MCLCKKHGLFIACIKEPQKYWCQSSHLTHFEYNNGLLARGMWRCLWGQWLLSGNFMISWGQMGCPAHSWTTVPAQGRSSLKRPATPMPQRAERGVPVLCGSVGSGLCWDRAHWHNWTLPSTKSWAGNSPVPFSDISIEKGPSYRGFLPTSVLVFILWVEGKCSLPQSSCIFDPTNSLHKQESI